MTRITLLILTCCMCSLASSAELVLRDLRLGITTQSPDYDYTVKAPTVNASGQDAFSSGWALDGGGRWSFTPLGSAIGLVVGADAIIETLPYGTGSGLSSSWLRSCTGGGWAVTDQWTLVCTLGGQIGKSTFKNESNHQQNASTQIGNAHGYDLRIETTYQINRRIGIGLDLGWLKAKHTLSGDQLDTTIDRSGWIVGLSAVWRFTSAPTRLD